MTFATATADVVRTRREASALVRPPLIVLDTLQAYLDSLGLGEGELRVEPIGEGHSNVTFLLIRDDRRLVLRRPPRPPFAASAHDVLREARVQRALAAAGFPVPRIFVTCDSPEILGVPFYLMEHLDGCVLTRDLPPLLDTDAARQSIGLRLVEALAELHAVAVDQPGIAGLGRPEGYLDRQVRRFTSIWEAQATRELPDVDGVGAWLARNVPPSQASSVVHGDFRLGNAMFATSADVKLLAVLDWEMATLGDPLADLGYLCAHWARPGDDETPMLALSAVTRMPGFLEREALVAHYERCRGARVGDITFYEVLALWKSAIFLESSLRRYRSGATDDPYFASLEAGVPRLARVAAQRIAGAARA
jgi:aminoglycoside phosphotransferase (APT) family kinase protein